MPSSAPSEGFVRVGRVGKPHGLDGSFVVERGSDDPSRFSVDAALWVGGEQARVVSSKRSRGLPVIKLDRAVQRGTELTVPVSELAPPAADSFYVFQLIGLEVEEEGGRRLGRVADVIPGVANDVLELDSGLALPMHEDCVSEVDLAAGRIVVSRGFADPEYPQP
ncbi:MAG TPA: ribosome maturation factor RimM [Gaiellaceae bacterium]|nr:ribosome maturation factor RimM [Gaiellaceae bacterium]